MEFVVTLGGCLILVVVAACWALRGKGPQGRS